MRLIDAFGIGFAVTVGMEAALGLCFALRTVLRGACKK